MGQAVQKTWLPPLLAASSVAAAILVGLICILASDWLVAMTCGYSRGTVNLHITLLLDRIEAWCMGGDQLVCPEGCPGSG